MFHNPLLKLTIPLIIFSFLTSCYRAGWYTHISGLPSPVTSVRQDDEEYKKNVKIVLLAEKYYLGLPEDDANEDGISPDDKFLSDKLTKEKYREIYATKMLVLINQNYTAFREGLVKSRKGLKVGADFFSLSLGTASSLMNPESTKSILAGLSTLTNSMKTSVSKTYFYEQALTAILNQMDAGRLAVLPSIYAGLKADIGDYPLIQVQQDLIRYIYAGTVDGALQSVVSQANIRQNDDLEGIKGELDTSIDKGNKRKERAQKLVQTSKGFEKLKKAISIWWNTLNKREKDNQLLALYSKLKEIGIENNKIDESEFQDFVTNQTFDPDSIESREILVAIALNAKNLPIPETD